MPRYRVVLEQPDGQTRTTDWDVNEEFELGDTFSDQDGTRWQVVAKGAAFDQGGIEVEQLTCRPANLP